MGCSSILKCNICLTQVCDEPHPLLVKEMIQHCINANINEAYKVGFGVFCVQAHLFSAEHLCFEELSVHCLLFMKRTKPCIRIAALNLFFAGVCSDE